MSRNSNEHLLASMRDAYPKGTVSNLIPTEFNPTSDARITKIKKAAGALMTSIEANGSAIRGAMIEFRNVLDGEVSLSIPLPDDGGPGSRAQDAHDFMRSTFQELWRSADFDRARLMTVTTQMLAVLSVTRAPAVTGLPGAPTEESGPERK